MAEQQQEQADPALPFGPNHTERVFSSHTDKIMSIFNSNRIDPATEAEAFSKMLAAVGTNIDHDCRLLSKYNFPNWEEEYKLLFQVCLASIMRQIPTVHLGGQVPGQPTVTFAPEEVVLLASCRSPVPLTAQVLFALLQGGNTHVTTLTVDARDTVKVSLQAFARHLIRSLRVEKPYGLYGHVVEVPPEHRVEVYAPLVQLLSYMPTPAKEAVLSIKCLTEDLKEHAANPKSVYVQDSGTARAKAMYPLLFWRLQRAMRSCYWSTIAALMHAPLQEGEPPRTGDEATRPDSIEDPESGYWVNKGDAFLKSVELGMKESEVNNGRSAVGIHPKEFSSLGFPQLHTPTLANVGPVGTLVICAGVLAGIVGLRMWANSSTPNLR